MLSRPAVVAISLAVAATAVSEPVSAQVPRLLKDLNTAGDGSNPFLQAEMGGYVYMIAGEPDHGDELWRSNGTAEGTTLVKDVWPGPTPSESFHLINAGGTIFFAPDTEEYGRELWKSDGTEGGTVLVKDIIPGPDSGFPERFVAVGTTLFFVARDLDFDMELWRSDGSEAGTRMVKDIYTGNEFGGAEPFHLTVSGGRVFFEANDHIHGKELWVSDGTEAGTRMVKDINPGERDSSLEALYDWNGTLYFAAADGEHGQELWRSDGTEAGTVLVKDIFPGRRWSFPGGFAVVGDTLFFVAEDPEHGAELRKTDGTTAGTVLVIDMRAGDASGGAYGITDVDGTAFFFAVDPDRDDEHFDPVWELWTSDGTEGGTSKVRDVRPGGLGFTDDEILEFDGRLIFSGFVPDSGTEIWASDGTATGTAPIQDIFPGEGDSLPLGLTRLGDRLLFGAADQTHGRELWATNGSEPGTLLVADINRKGTLDSGQMHELVELAGVLYFVAEDPESGRELWRSDGTRAGTYLLRDIHPGGDAFDNPYDVEIAVAGDRVFFFADDGVHGTELWVSDGTTPGTRMVTELVPGDDSSNPFNRLFTLRAAGSFAYVVELTRSACIVWRSDGSEEGTIKLLERLDCPIPLQSLGELMFLVEGDRMWRSDGTREGTFEVVQGLDFTGFKGSLDADLEPLGALLIFRPGTNDPERELWRTDGTEAGTFVIKDIAPGPASSDPLLLLESDGLVYFRADDGVHGAELWRTDGTEAGTSMVADLAPGPDSANPRPLADVEGTLFFTVANDPGDPGVGGPNGLWKTEQAGSPQLVSRDVIPFGEAAGLGDLLYFPLGRRETGNELWRSDGTRKGTVLVADLVPGFRDSRPSALTVAGRSLFFSADSNRFGRELWVVSAGHGADIPGQVTSVADLDGLGGDEVAVLSSRLIVLDAASGVEILASDVAPGSGWEAVDIEELPDLDGNGSAELAVVARRRQRIRLFVRDALTGELLASLRVRRKYKPLDLEAVPNWDDGTPGLALLTRRGVGNGVDGRGFLIVAHPGGERVSTVPLPTDFEALDLEVAFRRKNRRLPTLVILGRSGTDDRATLLTYAAQGALDPQQWALPRGLLPLDLEIVQRRPGEPGWAAVLVEKRSNGAARVLAIDLDDGRIVGRTRLDKRFRALDLEPAPGPEGSYGPAIALLLERRRGGKVRVTARDARNGRKLGRALFPGMLVPVDLAALRDVDDSGRFEVAVLGESECNGGEVAVVLRDSASGERLGCHPLP